MISRNLVENFDNAEVHRCGRFRCRSCVVGERSTRRWSAPGVRREGLRSRRHWCRRSHRRRRHSSGDRRNGLGSRRWRWSRTRAWSTANTSAITVAIDDQVDGDRRTEVLRKSLFCSGAVLFALGSVRVIRQPESHHTLTG
jgi:hypothetical protein